MCFLKEKWIDKERINEEYKGFYIITLESAFLLRTLFFVMFGITISLLSLTDVGVAEQSILIIAAIFFVRLLFLRFILWKKSIFPEVFISPRGLITVLLFYSIPTPFKIENFNQGVLMYIIIVTSVVMTIALIWNKRKMKKELNILEEYNAIHTSIEEFDEQGFTADDDVLER